MAEVRGAGTLTPKFVGSTFQYSPVVNFVEGRCQESASFATRLALRYWQVQEIRAPQKATMYQPWLGQLNKIHIALLMEEAASERAHRKARAATPKPAARPLAFALAAAAPIAIWIVWMWVAH